MTAKTLMVQGTSSSAGKSLLVTALCHIFARRGIKVAPFKSQNMSNNAAVCPDGGEIGRAQAVQAFAAGLQPAVDMNPVLIKPEADARSQIVFMGRVWKTLDARDYYKYTQSIWDGMVASLNRLSDKFDLIIMEGAGSPVELNLKKGDMVNMSIARYAHAPVLLVGDIDRGGIFAQLLGTLWLLPPDERALVRGLIINKFRGDIDLFGEGAAILEEKGGVSVLGVVPYIKDLNIPEEDAVALDGISPLDPKPKGALDVVVIHLPVIANFDDFDPLAAEPGVRVRYVTSPEGFGNPDVVILPGTKSTMGDLKWMREQGLDEEIRKHACRGGAVVGICGGYQMLGELIFDPDHVESSLDSLPGLDLLPIRTEFRAEKETHQVVAKILGGPQWFSTLENQWVRGYEIHMGKTYSPQSWLRVEKRGDVPASVSDGSVSDDGRIWGCYLHGIFDNVDFRRAWLRSLGWVQDRGDMLENTFQRSLTRLADTVESALNMEQLEAVIWGS